ncbi:MAG TPA: hypothetical protein VF532_03210 [Candidatus Angelobacter sp.]
MKRLTLFLVLPALLMMVVGCPVVDQRPEKTSAASMAAPAPSTVTKAEVPVRSDPASNGGSSLKASMPYSQPGAPVAAQNLNAAPFLIAAESRGAIVPALTWSPALTSRADGTMYGPADRPAAGIGQGMAVSAEGGKSPSKKATPKK